MNYYVWWSVLGTAYHGLPQTRRRLHLVCIRKGNYQKPLSSPPQLPKATNIDHIMEPGVKKGNPLTGKCVAQGEECPWQVPATKHRRVLSSIPTAALAPASAFCELWSALACTGVSEYCRIGYGNATAWWQFGDGDNDECGHAAQSGRIVPMPPQRLHCEWQSCAAGSVVISANCLQLKCCIPRSCARGMVASNKHACARHGPHICQYIGRPWTYAMPHTNSQLVDVLAKDGQPHRLAQGVHQARYAPDLS